MREKKNIDRLYQEKFKDFEATPNEAVWRSISEKLQEKEKKEPVIAPLWSRLGGIAAILTLILLIGEWFLPNTASEIANEETEDIVNPSATFREDAIAAGAEDRKSIKDNTPGLAGKLFSITEQSKKIDLAETSSLQATGLKQSPFSLKRSEAPASSEFEAEKSANKTQDDKPSLFEILNTIDEPEVIVASSRRRIEVSTHAAPIYYGNFGKGNFLDPQFNGNNSQGEVTYSYGINVSYAISDKVKVRSGVNKVNMSYNTSGIAYQAVADPRTITTVSYHSGPATLQSDNEFSGNEPVASSNRVAIGSITPGLLNQKMGFIEVPVELEYNLINSKLALNFIGGASTLFLDENMISVQSGLSSTTLGRANNINSVSFSTNIGLGLDYNLSEHFKLNLEPMFKYQINTFNAASSDSQPYYLGVYSGFSYKF